MEGATNNAMDRNTCDVLVASRGRLPPERPFFVKWTRPFSELIVAKNSAIIAHQIALTTVFHFAFLVELGDQMISAVLINFGIGHWYLFLHFSGVSQSFPLEVLLGNLDGADFSVRDH
ncbi:hypothetical protein [Profundibacter sp.]